MYQTKAGAMSLESAELGGERPSRRRAEQAAGVELAQRDKLVVPVESYAGADRMGQGFLHDVVQTIAIALDLFEVVIDLIEETGGIETAQVFAKNLHVNRLVSSGPHLTAQSRGFHMGEVVKGYRLDHGFYRRNRALAGLGARDIPDKFMKIILERHGSGLALSAYGQDLGVVGGGEALEFRGQDQIA